MFAALTIATVIAGASSRGIAVGTNGLGLRTPLGSTEASAHPRPSRGWLSPAARGKAVFFVSNVVQNAVEIFDADDRTGPGPIGSITDGISVPAGVAITPEGKLYVANSMANTITIYRRGQLTPSETLTAGLRFPNFIALSANGYLAVSNLTLKPYIAEFPPHGKKPDRELKCATLPLGLAYDTAGNLYIADNYGGFGGPSRILRVAPGSQQCVDLGLSGLYNPQGLAVDTAGNIWIGDTYTSAVTMYPPGSTQPGPLAMYEFLEPDSLAFDASEHNLYVADYLSQTVQKSPYGSNASFTQWWDYVQEPLGVAPFRGPWI